MKNITDQELRERFLATAGKLSHLKTIVSRRRHNGHEGLESVGDPFVQDCSALLMSKAWRRMSGKNQVASSPSAPHIRNRATHVGEVQAISIRLAHHLGLNEHLASAIALGHDLGHVPLGHQGEDYLCQRSGMKFSHEVMAVVIAQHIERHGHGLNLTHATLDGIFRHSSKNFSGDMTPEARIVSYADKIAYLFADFNDFSRMHWKPAKELTEVMNSFGVSQRERTARVMLAVTEESVQAGEVIFKSSEPAKAFGHLRKLMYVEYPKVVEQNVARILAPVYEYLEHSKIVPPVLGMALLTDSEVFSLSGNAGFIDSRRIAETGLGEIINKVGKEKLFQLDITKLDLDW